MKKLLTFFVFAALLTAWGPSAVLADDDEIERDHVKIEKRMGGGAKVTVVAGKDESADTTQEPAEKKSGDPALRDWETAPHKARLAVLPAVFSEHFHPEFKFSEKMETSGQLNLKMIFTTEHELRLEAPSYTLSLQEALVGSRKFDVLERARLDEVLQEIDFGESDYANSEKVVPIGRSLNAEYVVLPEIEVIHLVEEIKDIPYVDRVRPKLKGKLIARMRIVDTSENKVHTAVTEEVQVQRVLKDNNPFLATEVNNLVLDLYKASSMRMMQRALEAVYPLRLLEVKDGKAVLNRGEGALAVGDEIAIYTLGKAYVDPDTHEALGQSETKVATVKVTDVGPKFSEAEIIEGADQLTGDLKDYLCRETDESIGAKTKIEQTPLAW